jgi:hypothetical protein
VPTVDESVLSLDRDMTHIETCKLSLDRDMTHIETCKLSLDRDMTHIETCMLTLDFLPGSLERFVGSQVYQIIGPFYTK